MKLTGQLTVIKLFVEYHELVAQLEEVDQVKVLTPPVHYEIYNGN